MTDLPIPDAALDTHIGVLGRTGTGKTYTARGLVERLLDAKRQVVIVDPTSAWWGLRSVYPIPIFGGDHGDINMTDASGRAVAETILSNGTSAIVDLSLLARQSGAGMRRFMTAFVARLKDKDRGALWLVLDEADEFLPQVLSPDMTHLFGDLKWIVRRGRIAGWRVMMITQRPQDIAKSVLTQIGTLVAHRLTAPQDRKAVEEWVKGHADPEEAREVLKSLASLGQGEAWAWSPEHQLLVRATMPPVKSFDSGATPDADSGQVEQPALTGIDMSAIRATLDEAKSPGKCSKDLPATDNSDEIVHLEGERDDLIGELAKVRAELDHFKTGFEDYQARIKAALRALGVFTMDQLDDEQFVSGLKQVGVEGRQVEDRPAPTNAVRDRYARQIGNDGPPSTLQSDSARPDRMPRDVPPASTPSTLTKSQQRVIDALAWWHAWGIATPTNEQVGYIAGYSPSSGNFNNLKGQLRAEGLVEYPSPGRVMLTGAGLGLAKRQVVKGTREEFHNAVRAKLSASQLRLFDPALEAYPQALEATKLAGIAGYSATSGNFHNLRGQLRTIGLIDYPERGMVRASDWLFP